MSGVYVHIPFCKKACYYCDFHFSTSTKLKTDLINSIIKEIYLQQDFINQPVKSIYFGGGTPSILTPIEIDSILQAIKNSFSLDEKVEVTLEANPDDFEDITKIQGFKKVGVNRLSIGIQSFDSTVLEKLNRSHSSNQAKKAIETALEVGFNNISCDLIYGIPFQPFEIFKKSVHQLIDYQIPHISNYCLTLEENTVFGKWQKKNKIHYPTESSIIREFDYMQEVFSKHGYTQYEISNFAKSEFESFHNSNYWKNETYLGLGPSAHSYDGENRFYNVSNNARYLKSIQENNTVPFTKEILSFENKINEYLMTQLRTIWGIDLEYLNNNFSFDLLNENKAYLDHLVKVKQISISENKITLTNKGKLLADEISSNLFLAES